MASDNHSSALINAWRHNLWRCALNHFAISPQSDWQFVSQEAIAKGMLPNTFDNQSKQHLWVAPVVWQSKTDQTYWIPIWIPVVLQDKQFQISTTQLPWMPPAQFVPGKTRSPFVAPIHYFDEWLQFDWLDEEGKLVYQSWMVAYEAIQGLLDSLSNHTWQEAIKAQGFIQADAIVRVAAALLKDASNLLTQHFATIWDDEPKNQLDHKACLHQIKALGLPEGLSTDEVEASVHALLLQEGQLLAIRAPVGSPKTKFIDLIAATHVKAVLSQHQRVPVIYLYNTMGLTRYDSSQGHWHPCAAIVDGALLIIEDAQRFSPQQVLPLLAQVKMALFLGDEKDMTALQVLSAMPESWDLILHGLADDELLDQLHYKGMLPSTGNAMSVALANSAYQQLQEHGMMINTFSLLKDLPTPQYQGISVQSVSKGQGNGLINDGEAQGIANWLASGPLNQDLQHTAIVTPFVQQRDLIAHYLNYQHITCPVFTFFELTDKQWCNVVFSPVYTLQNQRPFVFDQGEHLLYCLMRRALKVWVIGSISIFDPKMLSPSGKLGLALASK